MVELVECQCVVKFGGSHEAISPTVQRRSGSSPKKLALLKQHRNDVE